MTSPPGPAAPAGPPGPPGPPGPLPAYPGPPRGAPGDVAAWHRLHPLSPLVRSGRHLTGFVVLLFLLFFINARQAGSDFITDLFVVALVLIIGVVNWAVTRWRVAGGVLLIDTGLIRRQSRRFPLSQVQAIDVVQTGLARVLGLAEIRLRMAGADSSGGRLVALRLTEAQALRQQLLAITQATSAGVAAPARPARAANAPAARRDPSAPAATSPAASAPAGSQPDERLLFRVWSGRLVVALALSLTGLIAAVVLAGAGTLIFLIHKPAVTAAFLPLIVGALIGVWRQFNGEFGTTVAVAPDGLRLRSGLVQTTAETIRPGRVQAVRLVEPLVWRAFGWCRLEVDVAGPRQRRENRSEGRRLRALVPVGTRADAEQMLGELVGSAPAPSRRPPADARWKAPLQYHFLAWGGDDRYVVASRGRVRRTTTWIPLEKVQSVRWVQGPVQRRLGLASVRLDVAGRRVTASIQDRDVAEAGDLLRRLPVLARAARTEAALARNTQLRST